VQRCGAKASSNATLESYGPKVCSLSTYSTCLFCARRDFPPFPLFYPKHFS